MSIAVGSIVAMCIARNGVEVRLWVIDSFAPAVVELTSACGPVLALLVVRYMNERSSDLI